MSYQARNTGQLLDIGTLNKPIIFITLALGMVGVTVLY